MINIWAVGGLILFLYMIEENRFVYHNTPSDLPLGEWAHMVFVSVIWPVMLLILLAERLLWIPQLLQSVLTKELIPWMKNSNES